MSLDVREGGRPSGDDDTHQGGQKQGRLKGTMCSRRPSNRVPPYWFTTKHPQLRSLKIQRDDTRHPTTRHGNAWGNRTKRSSPTKIEERVRWLDVSPVCSKTWCIRRIENKHWGYGRLRAMPSILQAPSINSINCRATAKISSIPFPGTKIGVLLTLSHPTPQDLVLGEVSWVTGEPFKLFTSISLGHGIFSYLQICPYRRIHPQFSCCSFVIDNPTDREERERSTRRTSTRKTWSPPWLTRQRPLNSASYWRGSKGRKDLPNCI